MKKILKALEKLDSTSLISISLFIFLIIYFIFRAFKFTPEAVNELDSLGQHIPLAESILEGKIFSPPELGNGLGYYMPIGELILSAFVLLQIPLGLYNVVAIIFLFYLCYKLAIRLSLGRNLSIVYAFSISYLNSVTRLVPTQKNDLWLNVFFVWVLYLLTKPKKDYKFFLLLGISVGLLVGVKYSGIILAAISLGTLFNNIKKFLNLKRLMAFSVPVILLGLIWYMRNHVITSNPFYPVSMFGFRGHPGFVVPRGYENFLNTKSLILTFQALISEYLVWSLLPIYFLVTVLKKKVHKIKEIKNLLLVGGFSTIVYLLGPTDFTRVNITSNMRFLHTAFIVLILATFIIATKLKKEREIIMLSILSSVAVLAQFSYYPKLIIIWLIVIAVLFQLKFRNKFGMTT